LKKSSKRRFPNRFETQSSSDSSRRFGQAAALAYEATHRVSSTGPELADHVRAAQRVVEELVVPVDARHAWAQQELVAHDLAPERLDLVRLREEAVAAEVEAESRRSRPVFAEASDLEPRPRARPPSRPALPST
jgi:hypothetical protein